MCIQLIVTVEVPFAKATKRMTPEATLIDGSWFVIASLLMPFQLFLCEQFMFMSKDFLVPRA
jgi:hypothetical protein